MTLKSNTYCALVERNFALLPVEYLTGSVRADCIGYSRPAKFRRQSTDYYGTGYYEYQSYHRTLSHVPEDKIQMQIKTYIAP